MRAMIFFWKLYMVYARIFYHLKIEGLENIPTEGACVFVFNHIAPIIDSMTGGIIMNRRPDVAIFGGAALPRGASISKFIPGAQEGGEITMLNAVKAMGLSGIELLKALKILQAGRPISLAAEGEISWDGKLQYPLTPGSAWMALRAHVPVVAAVSIGGYDVMPRWARVPRLTGKVKIRIGKPFYVNDQPITQLTQEMLNAASDRIYNEMAALING
jgi:1-acyl-sn-glycerol-3-phosphate acyltransferase